MTVSYRKLENQLDEIRKSITIIARNVVQLHGRLLKLEKPDSESGALPTIDLKGLPNESR